MAKESEGISSGMPNEALLSHQRGDNVQANSSSIWVKCFFLDRLEVFIVSDFITFAEFRTRVAEALGARRNPPGTLAGSGRRRLEEDLSDSDDSDSEIEKERRQDQAASATMDMDSNSFDMEFVDADGYKSPLDGQGALEIAFSIFHLLKRSFLHVFLTFPGHHAHQEIKSTETRQESAIRDPPTSQISTIQEELKTTSLDDFPIQVSQQKKPDIPKTNIKMSDIATARPRIDVAPTSIRQAKDSNSAVTGGPKNTVARHRMSRDSGGLELFEDDLSGISTLDGRPGRRKWNVTGSAAFWTPSIFSPEAEEFAIRTAELRKTLEKERRRVNDMRMQPHVRGAWRIRHKVKDLLPLSPLVPLPNSGKVLGTSELSALAAERRRKFDEAKRLFENTGQTTRKPVLEEPIFKRSRMLPERPRKPETSLSSVDKRPRLQERVSLKPQTFSSHSDKPARKSEGPERTPIEKTFGSAVSASESKVVRDTRVGNLTVIKTTRRPTQISQDTEQNKKPNPEKIVPGHREQVDVAQGGSWMEMKWLPAGYYPTVPLDTAASSLNGHPHDKRPQKIPIKKEGHHPGDDDMGAVNAQVAVILGESFGDHTKGKGGNGSIQSILDATAGGGPSMAKAPRPGGVISRANNSSIVVSLPATMALSIPRGMLRFDSGGGVPHMGQGISSGGVGLKGKAGGNVK
ncbi:hypothetical protein HDU67_007690 [Dinochytrium kinnereticum]|nr:hypothetical protein HDU67_007690 [Dinochytrium kinnereticum]